MNTDGFDAKNLRLANYEDGVNPIENNSLEGFTVYKIDVTKLTREALKEITSLGVKEKDRAKNMFVLGFLYWMYDRDMENTLKFLYLLNSCKISEAGVIGYEPRNIVNPDFCAAVTKPNDNAALPVILRYIPGSTLAFATVYLEVNNSVVSA